jgi:hypothetical protein
VCEHLCLKNVLTVMHLECDMRLSLRPMGIIGKDLTTLIKVIYDSTEVTEGQSYITISLFPFNLYKIRNGLTLANTDVASSPQV